MTIGGDPGAYGSSFADVYDDWYANITDPAASASFVRERCGGGPVLELGVGTGRLALPLAADGRIILGIDGSSEMLARCRKRVVGSTVVLVEADLARLPLRGPFAGAVCAFNTIFNLGSPAEQLELLKRVAAGLVPDGPLVIEAMTGRGLADAPRSSVGVSRIDPGRVVVAVTAVDHVMQTVEGRHIEIVKDGVRSRPWRIRWTTPAQLDELGSAAGLRLTERYRGWDGEPFTAESEVHVSVYTPT